MRKYYYTAFDRQGRKITGEMVGESQSGVTSALKDQGLSPTEVRDASGGAIASEDGAAPMISGGHDAAYYRRQRGQQATVIPVSIALMGLAAYGCHAMEADLKTTLIVLTVPALWLGLGVFGYVRCGRLAREAEAVAAKK